MADVRALLAAERQSRRISHPHLSYTKTGLICTLCNLNVKSETLWEGHLRSANHRKNAQASQENTTNKGVKRKLEDVDEAPEEHDEADTDARKKPKSRPESVGTHAEDRQAQTELEDSDQPGEDDTPLEGGPKDAPSVQGTSAKSPTVDEAEWAAFEAEVAPLKAAPADYVSHTIIAAPVTAAQMEAQAAEDGRRKLEVDADAEKEDEERRLEDEFEVMEEMEERVRRLREKRDALKHAVLAGRDTGQSDHAKSVNGIGDGVTPQVADVPDNDNEEDDAEEEEEEDDWYA
ncbi:hypothetical protein A1O1_00563 [Capronia coronata CBS 617.96]|uniref:C2H2-type domain-containing protein n=1 Tax=Capronia coronata CBS 617.96 TaxID=1182541 RepID=W9YRE1_9EURO|nr:uncharacterized protein A1O1_00563 [Capronia coronata CBS 617.96]EXJ95442.1 hypothetical protein A1O1_00563 [Capronia coronata CBS 617.96]